MSSALSRNRFLFTGLVLLATFAALAWEHFNGGIKSHHFLGNPSYPPMHNAWAVLILPALTWFAIGRIEKRGYSPSALIGFVGSLLYGAALAIAFAMGSSGVTKLLFFSAFALSALLPVYRAECALGFVLAMSWVFGPFIPSFFAAVFAAVSAFVHLLLWPVLKRLGNGVRSRSLERRPPKGVR